MLSTPWRRTAPSERIAAQAWEHLAAAVAAAGDTARSAARDTVRRTDAAGRRGARLADEAQSRIGSAADEAWQRANAAVEALAGRRPRMRWGWVAVAAVAGIAVGFAAAAALNAAREHRTELLPAEPPATESVHVDTV
jgi:ElaB/YqjD/DUF883 family membrane-anchored ribosome-binding protein